MCHVVFSLQVQRPEEALVPCGHRAGRILLNCQEAAPPLPSRLPITHLDFESLCELI
jgi:hypothetical protein